MEKIDGGVASIFWYLSARGAALKMLSPDQFSKLSQDDRERYLGQITTALKVC